MLFLFVNKQPRCVLEQCALEVFHKHVPKDYTSYDCHTSGAEWWVQIRPSPTTGRYTMHASNDENDDDDDEMAKTGISFHWDKDEDLRLLMGGSMYIHPHISTVTYITSFGPPTMALNVRIHPMTGEWIVPECYNNPPPNEQPSSEKRIDSSDVTTNTVATTKQNDANQKDTTTAVSAYISWPQRGKHLSFDGRYLHAAPGDFMESGEFENQIQFETSDDKQQNRLNQRRHRRVTFLVNIWLNYKPFNVNMFPDTMIDKLTKVDNKINTDDGVLFDKVPNPPEMNECDTIDLKIDNDTYMDDLKTFTWALGAFDSGEKMTAVVPIQKIQASKKNGGNCKICWDSIDPVKRVALVKQTVEKTESTNCENSIVNAKDFKANKTECTEKLDDSLPKTKRQRLE